MASDLTDPNGKPSGGGYAVKLLLIGATGTIGQAVAVALSQHHEVIAASRSSEMARVDITSPTSIRALFAAVGAIDGVISASAPRVASRWSS
ncbi:MAG TPA: NAD-dependent epimerase/dehydratase family protein [Streptosporangiaceae bacterium]|nr:NAD-dependent epimerase/dehydratase family protein [Streptosporangiaceae bacterium]